MTSVTRVLAGTALAAALAAAPGRAQTAPAQQWETSFRLERQSFTVDSAPWSPWLETELALRRLDERGTVEIGVMESRRFDAWDTAVAADAWGQLWRKAYGNVRVEVAPDPAARAELDVTTALFQGFDPGWELGAGWRFQRFPGPIEDVQYRVVSLTAARYLDGGYVRGGVDLGSMDGDRGASVTAIARYYLRPPTDLLEMGFAWGDSAELVEAGPEVRFDRGGTGHVRIEVYPWDTVGFGLSAQVRVFEDLPVRHGLSASLHARW